MEPSGRRRGDRPGALRQMRVTVLVGGKFHAIPLAEQLEKRGLLRQIFTSHPAWAFRSDKIDSRRIVTFPLAEAVGQGINRLTGSHSGDYWKAVLFDRFASSRMERCDALFGFASFCLHTMRRKNGACPLLLERACPHILDQAERLQEEALRLGVRHAVDPRTSERMLAEYALADRIVVPSNFSRNSFLRRGFDPAKVRLAPLSGKFPAPAAPPNREDQSVFRLLFVGGSFLRKGLIYLLRAWDGLRLKEAELVLRASDIPELPEVRKILGNPTIRLIPHSADLALLYSQASAFCLPSIDEGFGMVVLEAMSYGLPVIVTENVGAADCIRDGVEGFIVKIRDAAALEEKILSLYENKAKRLAMGEAAAKRTLKYTWDVYGDAVAGILSDF